MKSIDFVSELKEEHKDKGVKYEIVNHTDTDGVNLDIVYAYYKGYAYQLGVFSEDIEDVTDKFILAVDSIWSHGRDYEEVVAKWVEFGSRYKYQIGEEKHIIQELLFEFQILLDKTEKEEEEEENSNEGMKRRSIWMRLINRIRRTVSE